MNGTEAAYAEELRLRVIAGEVEWWGFEAVRLRLAAGAWFKPDFAVVIRGGLLEFHEVKGFWREAARVRIKVAAEVYPFRFVVVKRRRGGGWDTEEIIGQALRRTTT